MLEKPNVQDDVILSHLNIEYNLHANELRFLPLGADMGTAVYQVVTDNGTAYFLKLRKGFDEISITIPLFLKSQGVKEIISLIETKSKQGWANFGEYKMILYPFIKGRNGFEAELSNVHKRVLGATLKAVHSVPIPPELKRQMSRETFSPKFHESMKSFQKKIKEQTHNDPVAAKLVKFIQSKQDVINHLIERAETLAAELQSKPLEFVLCHTDIHGGNMLIGENGEFFVVDWDAPLLAPKERDLMFVGGGIDNIWKTKRDEALFYEGYGETKINIAALAYYRSERIIVDLVEFCNQLLLSDEGGADREQAYRWFTSNFEVGSTIEIAEKTGHH